MTTIRNTAHQHREFQSRLNDVEKLRLYAQSATSHHHTLNASLAKAESLAEHWEREANEGVARVIRAEKERDEVKQEARAAQLMATSARDAKARVEIDLTKALNSLAAAEEGGCRSEGVISRLEAERASLLLELEASKGDVSSLHVHVENDKEDKKIPGISGAHLCL